MADATACNGSVNAVACTVPSASTCRLRKSRASSAARATPFVVIANELKATADQVSAGAGRLKPILDNIEKSAGELRGLRVHGDPAQLTRLEPAILEALHEIEEGNDRLSAA
jgi:hypothetical protein